MEALARRTALTFEKKNAKAATTPEEQGVNRYGWAPEDRRTFREVA